MEKIVVYFMLLAVLLFTGCKSKVKHYGIEAKGPSYSNLQEMEDESKVIVRVTREEYEKPVITYNEGRMVSGYTFSKVKIEEIFKDTTNSLKVGDSIRILENEVFSEKENAVYHIGGYNMMEEDEEYILFLNRDIYYDKEAYYVAKGTTFGTVPVEEDNRATVYFDKDKNPVNSVSGEVNSIWEKVLEKYKEK